MTSNSTKMSTNIIVSSDNNNSILEDNFFFNSSLLYFIYCLFFYSLFYIKNKDKLKQKEEIKTILSKIYNKYRQFITLFILLKNKTKE